MNLLIITQKVNKYDSNLGFFHNWILEFAKHCSKLTVICLEKGDYDLPDNVKIFSLGKESGRSKIKYLFRFYKYIWQQRKNYDHVFVHMNGEYIILAAWLWKFLNKKIGLWYMHKSVTNKLKLAEKLTDIIFTGSKDSFRWPSKKVKILHHGIDNKLFYFHDKKFSKYLNFLTVGRISESKNIHLMIDLMSYLKDKIGYEPELKIIGAPIYDKDKKYLETLHDRIDKLGLKNVDFLGSVINTKLPPFYQEADLFLNFSDTGSLDKAILESLSCGTLVISSNDSSREFLPSELFVEGKNIEIIGNKVLALLDKELYYLKESLNLFVKEKHSLKNLVIDILKLYE